MKGKTILAFTHSSFDPANHVMLLFRTDHKTIKLFDMKGGETLIQTSESDGS